MSKIFLTAVIFIVCIALIQSAYVQSFGWNVEDFFAPSISRILDYLSNNALDINQNRQTNIWHKYREEINACVEEIKEIIFEYQSVDKNFGDDIFTTIKLLFISCDNLVYLFFTTVGVAVSLIGALFEDFVECILWIFGILYYLIIPLPKSTHVVVT